MTFVHGKGTATTIDGKDLSPYSNKVEIKRKADTHDVTCFGKTSKVYNAGLKDGEGSLSGIYDNTATTGPGAVLRGLVGAGAVELVYMPEGDALGRPAATVDVLVNGYDETSAVADMVTWSASLQLSDDIVDSVQS